jgi:glycosyltransferase involved in cell wall biosynthesis
MSADNFNLEKFKLFQDKKVDVVTKCVLGTLTDEDLLELKSLIDFWPETKFDFSELSNYDSSSYRYVKFRYKSSASLFQSVNPTIEINNILYKTETEWVDNRTDSHYIIKLCPM